MAEKIVAHLTSAHEAIDIRIFYKECRSLATHGYKVCLIAPHPRLEVIDNVRIVPVASGGSRLWRMTLTVWEVFRTAIRQNADFYHLHDPELLIVGQVLRMMGKHVVFDMHENLPKSLKTKPWIPRSLQGVASTLFKLAERILLFNIPVIFAESSYAEDYTWVKEQTVVLNMPVIDDLARIGVLERHEKPTIGYFGVVSPVRGSLVTLEALKILKDDGLCVRWECVGPIRENYAGELVGLRSRLALRDVNFYGYMKPEEGWQIMARCHAALAVILPLPNYVGSYPTKMFEYMALGIPVVVSNFPLYRRVVDGSMCGICVDPEDPRDVAKAIRLLVEQPHTAQEMGENGRAAVKRQYNWGAEGRKLLELYDRILLKERAA